MLKEPNTNSCLLTHLYEAQQERLVTIADEIMVIEEMLDARLISFTQVILLLDIFIV